MVSKQGDLALLDDPIAQELLQSRIPARLAYVATDGTPRAIPINFHWDGKELVLGVFPASPKVKALKKNPKVALTIDTEAFPAKVLMIRGTASLETQDGVVPEYALSARRYMGEEGGNGWLQQLGQLGVKQMTRVAIRPEWVGLLDFQRRFPHDIERAVEAAQAGAGAR